MSGQLVYYELREPFMKMVDYGESSNVCAMNMFLGDVANTLEEKIRGEDLVNNIIKLLGNDARKIIDDIASEGVTKDLEIINVHRARSLRKVLLSELLGEYTSEPDQDRGEMLDTLLDLMRYLVNDVGKVNMFWKFMNEALPQNLLTLLGTDPSGAISLRLATTLLAMLELNYINKEEECIDTSPPQYRVVKGGRDELGDYRNTTNYIFDSVIDIVMGNSENPCTALCQSIHQASGLGLTLKDYLQSLTQIEPYFTYCYEELSKCLEDKSKNELLLNDLTNHILRGILKHPTMRKKSICSLPAKCKVFYEKLVKCLCSEELVSGKISSLIGEEDVIKSLEKLREKLREYLNQELPLLIYAFASICGGNVAIPHVKVVDAGGDIFIDDVDLLVISIKGDVGRQRLVLIPYLVEVSAHKLRIYVSDISENISMFTAYLKRDNYLFKKYEKYLRLVEEFEDVYVLMLVDIVVDDVARSKLNHLDRVECIVREHPICLYSPRDGCSSSRLVVADIKGYANPLLFNVLLDIVRFLGYYDLDSGAWHHVLAG